MVLKQKLARAIQRNDTPTALLCLQQGADPKAQAADTRPVTLVAMLKKLFHKSADAPDSLNVLALAVQSNNTTLVQALLVRGAREAGAKLRADDGNFYPEGVNEDGVPCTLLMYAASKGNADVVRCLLQHGSNIRDVDEEGESALTYANNGAAVEALVAGGADVNAKDKEGSTVVSMYVMRGNVDALPALLAHGAKDRGAMTFAVHRYHAECLKAMLDAGWNVDMKDEEGWPPLMIALYSPGRLYPEIAMLLIKRGANVNFRSENGRTPLLFAADGGRYPPMDPNSPKLVQALVDRGANINAKDEYGITPLMMASFHLRPVLVRQLLQQGANIHARDKDGQTALYKARHSPYKDTNHEYQYAVVRLLKRAGAKE